MTSAVQSSGLSPIVRAVTCLVLAVPISPAHARPDDVPTEAVLFQHSYLTQFGDSVFLLGDIEALGGGDVKKSLKMVPGVVQNGTLPWSLQVALPQNTAFTYRFVRRDDDVADWKNPANGVFLTDWIEAQTTPANPALRAHSILMAEDAAPPTATFQTSAGPLSAPFSFLAQDPSLVAAQAPCQLNGATLTASVGAVQIATPLQTVFLRGTHLFSYVPAAGADSSGTIQTIVIETDTVPDTRTIDGVTGRGVRIYLPRGYAQQSLRRYPVLYMHDGQNCFKPGGPFGCWFAEDVANLLIQQARIRELIIVAVDNSPERSAEYVPEFGNATVTNADYNSFLINELKPVIDAAYRTLPQREHTAVMGSSFGGIASLVLGLEHGDVFGAVAAMSPSFWAGATGSKVSGGQVPDTVRMYFDSGDTSDGQETTLQVRDAVLKTGRVLRGDFYYTVGFNHQHNEVAWNKRLPEALEYLFPATAEANGLNDLLPPSADLSGDGAVDQADLNLVLASFDLDDGGDINGDGATNQLDLNLLLAAFGSNCP